MSSAGAGGAGASGSGASGSGATAWVLSFTTPFHTVSDHEELWIDSQETSDGDTVSPQEFDEILGVATTNGGFKGDERHLRTPPGEHVHDIVGSLLVAGLSRDRRVREPSQGSRRS